MQKEIDTELKTFIENWQETAEHNRTVFLHLLEYLTLKKDVSLNFISRPGITFSLRAVHRMQQKRNLFIMIDVIEDTPRWLSLCFYSDMITDPDELGDFVPEGLLGEDALCFDIEEQNVEHLHYLEIRIDEAYCSASQENLETEEKSKNQHRA